MPRSAELLALFDSPQGHSRWPAGAALARALDEAAIVAITDVSGDITYCNDKFCEISGYTREELLGSNHRLLNSGFHDKDFFRGLYRTISRGEVWRGALCNKRKDGTIYWVDTTIVPQIGPDSRPQSYIAIRVDITQHIALQAQLASAHREAAAAAASQGRFFANMSHEIRTPLAGLTGLVHLLAGTELNETQRGYLNTMEETAQHLRMIVDDVLLLSQAEAHAITLHPHPTQIAALLRRVTNMIAPTASGNDTTLALDIAPSVPCCLDVDATRLSQVLANLLGNAIKFTVNGEVRLTASWASDRLRCEVKDSGPGFDPDQKARLFRAFGQEVGSGRHAEGTGLGLAIAAGIVEAMGGRIDAENAPEGGALFWFEAHAPEVCYVAPAQVKPETSSTQAGSRRVLVVEDNETLRLLTRRILEEAGHEVELAVDGEDGLNRLREQAFDLCFMDLRMPRMTGPEAIAHIRSDTDPRVRATPVVALSADILDVEDERLAAMGFDGFLAKPIQVAELLALVSLIGQAAGAA